MGDGDSVELPGFSSAGEVGSDNAANDVVSGAKAAGVGCSNVAVPVGWSGMLGTWNRRFSA